MSAPTPAELYELVLGLGDAVSDLTGQLATLAADLRQQRSATTAVAGVMARHYSAEGLAVPDDLASVAPPEPQPLRLLRGGAR